MSRGEHIATVLLVDDDPLVLSGLSLWFQRKRPEWAVLCAESGRNALAVVRERTPDVVISDFDMPSMNGLELLRDIRSEQPDVARILFSGHVNEVARLAIAAHAQEQLGKPSAPSLVVATVDKALALSKALAAPRLREAARDLQAKIAERAPKFERFRNLASAPQGMAGALGASFEELFPDSQPWLERAHLGLVGQPAITRSLAELATKLGPLTSGCVALQTELLGNSEARGDEPGRTERSVNKREAWHALVTGCFAAGLLRQTERPDAAFAAGLLHDLSRAVDAGFDSESAQTVLELTERERISEVDAEREANGASHAELGAAVARDWGLPLSVVEAILFHHDPENSTEEEFGVTGAVHVADSIDAERLQKQISKEVPSRGRPRCGGPQLEFLDRVGGKSRLMEWIQLERGVEKQAASDGLCG